MLLWKPWLDAMRFGFEVQSVIALRLLKIATGGAGSGVESTMVNGDPSSLTKMKSDVGLSRWSRRRARSLSPWVGVLLGVSFMSRRTWSTAPLTPGPIPGRRLQPPEGRARRRPGSHFDLRFRMLAAGIGAAAATGGGWT
jgi:hypothetical protein